MKNIILKCLSILLFPVCCIAQEVVQPYDNEDEIRTDYNWVVGGVMEYSTSNTDGADINYIDGAGNIITLSNETERKSVVIGPYIGRKAGENWLLGLSLTYQYDKLETSPLIFPGNPIPPSPVTRISELQAFGIGVFGRYTFNPGNVLKVFAEPGLRVTFVEEMDRTTSGIETSEKFTTWSIEGDLGATYDISPRFGVLTRIGLLSYSYSEQDDNSREISSFNFSLRLSSIGLGLEYKF